MVSENAIYQLLEASLKMPKKYKTENPVRNF